MLTTHTLAVYFIDMGTHKNCLNGTVPMCFQKYTHMTVKYINKEKLFNIPGYSLELPQCDSSEYPKIHMTRIYRHGNYSHKEKPSVKYSWVLTRTASM